MAQRQQLQQLLESVIGSSNVYFQPPENIKMQYPCIVYQLDGISTEFADNLPYAHEKGYQVTVIDLDPDTPIPDLVAKLPKCLFTRHFKIDNLNHYVFKLYF